MPKITYVAHDGTRTEQDVPVGWSVMEGAVQNNIDGIDADCGGCLSCATCHIFVDPAWVSKLPPKEDLEDDMLDCAAVDREDNSRLSCQLTVTEEMDGLVVTLPEFQS
ncbi:MAG: 2Fe-2S iron-sulfur cluster-binding protein [Pseudomonadota bacterium]